MKTLSSLLTKQSNVKFSLADLMRKRSEETKSFNKQLAKERNERFIKALFGRSGITPLYKDSAIGNYIVETTGQQYAKDFAYNYIINFNKNKNTSFIFSGEVGTGKNHLAAAICNNLLAKSNSCLIISVEELMINSRKCYGKNPKYSEDEFFKQMAKIDLLIIDEVGLQCESDREKIVLNGIIEGRVSNLKSTGILTNEGKTIVKEILGSRIFSRMKSSWIPFEWEDFRGRK